jgi:hypothetical protein
LATFLSKHALKLLLSLALITGAAVYRDYGLAWDEDVSYLTGLANYNYAFHNDTSLYSFPAKDYGSSFEFPATIIIKALGLDDMRDIYLARRILTYLLFVIACACMFLLADMLYHDKLAAAAAFLMLWLHPQVFSHAFFNSKDVPFLSFLVITLFLLFKATQKKEWWWFCLAGAAAGLLTGTRMPGVIYVALCVGWIFSEGIAARKMGKGLLWAALFCVCSVVTLYVTWPNLWNAPVENFMHAFSSMSKFRWDLSVLLIDEYFLTSNLPWYYIPVWFVITMPLLFLVLGACGILLPFWTWIRGWRFDFSVRKGLFLLLCFVFPVLCIIGMHSIVYDGWRHVYFIYAPFVLLSADALNSLSSLSRRAAAVALVVVIVPVCCFHFYAHPFQYVYFNAFTKHNDKDLRYEYEIDYWGLSYKQGLEFLLSTDTAAIIPIAAENAPCELNVRFLPPEKAKRFRMVPLQEARYFLTNYRWHRRDYTDLPVKVKALKTFKVCETSVQTVFTVGE